MMHRIMGIKMGKIENNRSLKILSVAALIGTVVLGTPAMADVNNSHPEVVSGANKQGAVTGFAADVVLGSDEATELLKNKPVETPTLDYLKENNILIPQKKYDETTKEWIDGGEPIEAPESAYKITAGTEADHTFDYTTADKDGNLTHNYYKIQLSPSLAEGETGEGAAPTLGTSKNIQWQEVSAPAEGASLPENTIKVDFSNGSKYYQYTYQMPADYTEATTRVNTLDSENAVNKVFQSMTTSGYGAAIYNTQDKSTTDIKADFINNSVSATSSNIIYRGGGAISNTGTIGDITGAFIGNSVSVDNTDGHKNNRAYGGAIYNTGKINSITGDFINNWAYDGGDGFSLGGAIYNYHGTIGDIKGNFIGNFTVITRDGISHNYDGGVIYNYIGTIGNITGVFINNSTSAIFNAGSSTIGNIIGDFINNSSSDDGGAIYNYYSSTIGNITGDFINNSATSSYAYGGAIYNDGTIGNITGDFINNSATGSSSASGGAIYNSRTISNITGDFINNSANTTYYDNAYGGAIYNYGTIGNITGDFINNSASSTGSSSAYGGAIYNEDGKIGNITGDFINNSAISKNGSSGGAIYAKAREQEEMQNTILSFQMLTILNDDGTVYKTLYMCEGSEADIKESIDNGLLTGYKITYSDEMSKSALEAGLADMGVTFDEYIELVEQQGAFISTTAPDYLFPNISMTYPHLTNTEVRAETADISLVNSNLIGNHVESENSQANGGAIYSENATIKLTVNNGKTSYISGNYVDRNGHKDDNAIYMNGGKLIFDTTNGSTIQLDDNIKGLNYYKTYIIGDDKSKFVLNNSISNSEVNLIETNLYLTKDNNLDNNHLVLHSGSLSMLNNQAGIATFNSLTLTGNTNFIADVDLANAEMDRFTANSYGEHSGNLNVVGMNLLSDAASDKTEVFFAEQGLKNNVTTNVKELSGYTPIYKYNVTYNNKTDGGYFVFQRGSNGGNSSDAFNPSVLAPSVAAQAGATATMGQVFNYAFQNADNFMNIPYLERISIKNANKYALSPTGDATDVGVFSPLFTNNESSSVWVKPYASFENVPLKNGPKVSNITYGTLIGYDTNLIPMKNGWDRVWTGYIGYNGASQRYSGIDSTQNGGLLGGTLTLYKGNFFNATTLSAGANVANNQTMYGNENFTMLLAGLGNKTGYNFEFKEGKLILQPSMLMSYTFVNTFDYTNAAGVKMNSNPLHAIQLAPGLKLIANLKNGWQPYASVNMVWNLLDKSDVRANDVKLPEMSIKPYIQYGVGVQKRFKDKCMAYGQAMIQNGGRNGIALTFGFRWSLGKEGKGVNEKVMNPSKNPVSDASQRNRTVLKQLTPTQKTALGAKPQNTTRTTNSAILKQL